MAFTAASPFCLFCTLFVLDARVLMVSHREVAERRYAKPPHGSFTPTAVLTEPPPLLEPCDESTSQELWLDGSTIIIPTVIAVSVAYPIPAAGYFAHQKVSRRTKLSWLVLSHIIGTEVPANVYSLLRRAPSEAFHNNY